MTQAISSRRQVLSAAGGLAISLALPAGQAAELPDDLTQAIKAFTQGKPWREGKVAVDIAELIDNGNAVPLTINVTSAMTEADHVQAIAVFNERNPQRDVFLAQLGPQSGRAEVSTRIRLATTQKIVAVARMNDGTHWSKTVEVIVTLAACIEGEA
jgi:sulfur-oxidizing protein SoxY